MEAALDFQAPAFTTTPGAVAMSCDAKIGLANDLSIATADARTPEPTYGISAISRSP